MIKKKQQIKKTVMKMMMSKYQILIMKIDRNLIIKPVQTMVLKNRNLFNLKYHLLQNNHLWINFKNKKVKNLQKML